MSTHHEKFWLEDPSVLFTNLEVVPKKDMTQNEKLNAMTRLIVVVSLVLLVMNKPWWVTFLIVGVVAVALVKALDKDNRRESFTALATYTDPSVNQTIVSPLWSEEFRVPPPDYFQINNTLPSQPPDALEQFPAPAYPYGQYMSTTNMLPQEEYAVRNSGGSANIAREFVNSQFLRNRIAFQEDMTRIYKKKLARRFRSNTGDTFSPFSSV